MSYLKYKTFFCVLFKFLLRYDTGDRYMKQKIKIEFRVCNLAYTSLLKT